MEVIIDTDYLLHRRITKLEANRFSNVMPDVLKQRHIKDNEELIKVYKDVKDYATTAKNLALKYVYEKIWFRKDPTNDERKAQYLGIFSGLENVTPEDTTVYNSAAGLTEPDFVTMATIIDKYIKFDLSTYVSIKDLAMSPEYIDIYKKAYDHINLELDKIDSIVTEKYNEYTASIDFGNKETGNTVLPKTLEEFAANYKHDAGILIKNVYDSIDA